MAEFDWASTGDKIFVRSVVSKPTCTFYWSVENFSKLLEKNKLTSPLFFLSSHHKFYARLEILSDTTFRITFSLCSGSGINISHKYTITDRSGRIFQENTVIKYYSRLSNNFDVEIANVSTPALVQFLSDAKCDTLIFKCIMEGQEIYTKRVPFKFRPQEVSSSDNLSALSRDLKDMYNASLYADVSLKVGDDTIRVHKSVMCARSSVFARMFTTPMGESEKNIVDITDLELPVLQDLVSYMYTGELPKDDFESVCALYYAADKYDVSSLRKTCIDVLLSTLDVENACRVLTLADRHSDVEFKDSLLHFVKFYIDKILETCAFNDLETPLKNEVKSLIDK